MECLLNRQTNRSSLNPILQIYGRMCQLLMTLCFVQFRCPFFFSLTCFLHVKGVETTLIKQLSTSGSCHSKIAFQCSRFPINSRKWQRQSWPSEGRFAVLHPFLIYPAICLLDPSFVINSLIPFSIPGCFVSSILLGLRQQTC